MMEKLQRFGGAMFTPVLLFAFAGLILSLSILLQNPMLIGSIANEGTHWSNFWAIVEAGGWTVFNHIELLFVLGLPMGLANHANARAALESFVVYTTFNNFLSKILELYGPGFNVDFTQEVGGASGLKLIAGTKTLDTNLVGAILIAAIVVWIHNKYFNKKLPDFLGVFQGSSFVVLIGFFIMIPLAFLTAWVWPVIQIGISRAQELMVSSGVFGVWSYVFAERILIPTGLHHFIYQPFIFGPAVVEGGIEQYWLSHLSEFASSSQPLKELMPFGGFALHNVSKFFAPIGIAGAFYATALPENRKKVLSLVVPTAMTAMLAGITEPFEFTFLFIAPMLFVVHSILAATLGATLYLFGVVGDIGSGFISMLSKFILPMATNHSSEVIKLFIIGFIFSGIYFVVFRFLILKFNFLTPGRTVEEEIKLYSKDDYKEKAKGSDRYQEQAQVYLEALGGPDNIASVNNCATRLRISVKDPDKIAEDQVFIEGGAHVVVRNGNAVQVIVGLDVPQVREAFERKL